MSGKNINFNHKKIKKNTFYKGKNTLSNIMIMILLDHYV